MPNTDALLGLIPDYTEAFADPEATPEDPTLPDMPEPDEEGRTGESPQDYLTPVEECYLSLLQLDHEPELMEIASEILSQLASVASMKKHLANEPIRQAIQTAVDSGVIEFDLPETHARQGTAECPGGMCPIDH